MAEAHHLNHIRHLENRIEQLEDVRNVVTNNDFYEKLAAVHPSPHHLEGTARQSNRTRHRSLRDNPDDSESGTHGLPLHSWASVALMGFRGVGVTNAFIGDFFGVAGIGMVVTAQWEIVLGNIYAYTVLSAFGFFYAGFGFTITPFLGVAASYDGGASSPEYNNAVGFFVLSESSSPSSTQCLHADHGEVWAVLNIFFLLGSLPLNLVYIGIFFTVQMAFTLVAAQYFLIADGKAATASAVGTAAGAFAFASGMLGYYTLGNLMCQESLFFSFPMGDTSRFFKKKDHTPKEAAANGESKP
ncbi:uncharacterized protein LTR77_004687 [Saxophila tyrrhenica]|uniref:Uncharacterized protein n=1 Tax=Saxophila tyrrhenica TaxID=1690608 RepID=A0AAV9PDY7_9PEZI|nr:hypothetical protein LTR77_004687 [Saxophila tyrrhenica]